MSWNYDLSAAPGPTIVHRAIIDKNGHEKKYTESMMTWVLVAVGDAERKVMASHYIPAQPLKNAFGKSWPARWAGLATGQVPLAWMPYPDHPQMDD